MPIDYALISDAIKEGRDAVAAMQAGKKFTAIQHAGYGLAHVGEFGAALVGEDQPAPLGSVEVSRHKSAADAAVSRSYAENRGDTAAATTQILDQAEEMVKELKAQPTHAAHPDSAGGGNGEEVGGILDNRPILVAIMRAALLALIQALAV